MILGIDPGTAESGWALYDEDRNGKRVKACGVLPNAEMLAKVSTYTDDQPVILAIEMIASYGMAVGKEVFETCVWIGRFMQAWHTPGSVKLVYRKEVKQHLCGTLKAKDANIRQALIDMIGPQGTKNAPGPTYGIKAHAWPALAVAVTLQHRINPPPERPFDASDLFASMAVHQAMREPF